MTLGRPINTIGRQEIIRGYKSFEEILGHSIKLEAGDIEAFVNLGERSPSFPVKVGFLLSKKKLKNHMIETV